MFGRKRLDFFSQKHNFQILGMFWIKRFTFTELFHLFFTPSKANHTVLILSHAP